MNGIDFNQLVKGLEGMEEAILLTKGADYTQGDADRLKNFKRLGSEIAPILKTVIQRAATFRPDIAALIKEAPMTFDEEALQKMGTFIVFWIYFRKHIDALNTYIVTGRVESEGLVGRVNDVRNYMALGAGLMVDFGDMSLPKGPGAPVNDGIGGGQ